MASAIPILAQEAAFHVYDTAISVGTQILSFTYVCTAHEAFVPVEFLASGNISTPPQVNIYRSGDAGDNWETEGDLGWAFSDLTGGGAAAYAVRRGLVLSPGYYLITINSGTGSYGTATFTCGLGTAEVITAYES